ncbi:hypothetical protein SGFS_003890 [Streptomyces graminofaciens]|uniref:Transposase n=1 Tax=Streptomyces graminofaciens TaxID=68212 RepID=A0ABM7F062_9ACTN|nr:hypothetical protein SGFS_003890 [Streptomyces graminofaciens]
MSRLPSSDFERIKWVNHWRLHGDAGLQDRPSSPHRSPNATPAWVIEQIESWRREHKWSAQRVTDELVSIGFVINRRTVSRHLTRLGLGERRFIDPGGENNRKPGKITRPLARTHRAPGCEEGRPDP